MLYRVLCLILTLVPLTASAQSFNAGIVQGLWYSEPTVFADEPTRIYVAIRNNSGADLTGRIEFYDNEELIARQNVSAINGRIIESWADWEPNYGEHTIRAALSRTELHTVGSSTKRVEITANVAEDTLFADFDTDHDGIGNQADPDDDGDGVSDEDEKRAGTDPLTYDAPKPEVRGAETETSTEAEETVDHTATTPSNTSFTAGFEQYLTPSPARTALSAITEHVTTAKKKLDTYRVNRSANSDTADTMVVDDSGFGEITRSSDSKQTAVKQSKPSAEQGFLQTIADVLGKIIYGTYSVLLTITSFTLSYPSLIQLLLLLLTLYLVYRLAKRYGQRRFN